MLQPHGQTAPLVAERDANVRRVSHGRVQRLRIARPRGGLRRGLLHALDGDVPGIEKKIAQPYDDVLAKIPEALATEGFGVLTRVDVHKTLREKLGVDFRRYTILGACNPALAHRALQADLSAGVLLPCNVIVYEDGDRTVVVAVDPMETAATRSNTLRPIVEEVRSKLTRVLEHLR